MIRALSIVLVLQLAAGAYLFWPRSLEVGPRESLAPGLSFAAVERMVITDGNGSVATLDRRDDVWHVNDTLPADPVKVDTLLAALLNGDPGLAIATSSGAAARFKVADESYERRVVLSTGDSEATVYLGSAPSFRKIHARRAGDPSVFVIELNSYDAPTDANAWLDRTLLAVDNIASVELYGVTYARDGDTWARSDGEPVDPEAMEQLVEALANLRVSGLVDDADEDARAAGETLRLSIVAEGETTRITVLDNPDSERFYLSSDRYDPTFDTSAFDAERLIEAARSAAMLEDPQDPGENDEAVSEDAL